MLATTAQKFGSSGKSFQAPSAVAPTIGAALLASGTSDTADTAWSPSAACLLPDILPVAGTMLSYGGSRQLAAGGTVTHGGALTITGQSRAASFGVASGAIELYTGETRLLYSSTVFTNIDSGRLDIAIGGVGQIRLGGTGSSHAGIYNSGTTTKFRTADNSADAPITCGAITASGHVQLSNASAGYIKNAAGGLVSGWDTDGYYFGNDLGVQAGAITIGTLGSSLVCSILQPTVFRGNSVTIRNGLTPTQLQLHSTYTSSTSFACLDQRANSGGTAYEISSFKGSAGGSNLPINIGHRDSAGTFTSALSVATNGNITLKAGATIESGYGQGLTIGNSSNALTLSVFDLIIGSWVRVHSNLGSMRLGATVPLEWESSGSPFSYTAATSCIIPNVSGQIDVRGNSGLRVRNYANSADAALTCGAINASEDITVPVGKSVVLVGGSGSAPYGSIVGTAASRVEVYSGGRVQGSFGYYFGFDGLVLGNGTYGPMLWMGGTSAAYPAIKRSGTTTAFRLADDSADGPITCGSLTTSGNVNIGANSLVGTYSGIYNDGKWLTGTDGYGSFFISPFHAGFAFRPPAAATIQTHISYAGEISTITGLGLGTSNPVTTDVRYYRNATGPKASIRAAGGLEVKDLAGSADAALTCGAITASGAVSCPQINGIGTGYSVGVFGPSTDLSSAYRNVDINAPSGLPVLQFKTNGTLRAQHYWESNVFNIYSAGNHAITSSSATQMLGFGGLMAGTPALKRVLNTLQVRLGDDSNFADLYTGALIASAVPSSGVPVLSAKSTVDTTSATVEFYSHTNNPIFTLKQHPSTAASGILTNVSQINVLDTIAVGSGSAFGSPSTAISINSGNMRVGYDSSTMKGYVGTYIAGGLSFYTGNVERLSISSTGAITTSGTLTASNAYFSASKWATTTVAGAGRAQLLGDYQAVLAFNGNAGSNILGLGTVGISYYADNELALGNGVAGNTGGGLRCAAITATGAGAVVYINRSGMSSFSLGDANGDTFRIQNAGDLSDMLRIHGTTKTATFYGGITASGQISCNTLNAGTGNIANNGASTVYIGSISSYFFASHGDGVVELCGASLSGSGFGRLQLGGTTSSFPAIKRSGTTTAFRLADDSADGPISCGAITASGNLTLSDTNLITGTTTGTIIATTNSQKLGFWGATPIVQPTTAVAAATLVSNGGTTLTDTDLFDGYTLKQIVKALRVAGLLA